MAQSIGKVRATFTASASGLQAGVNQASASMKRLERDVRGLRGGLSTLTAISGAQLFGSIASGVRSAVTSLAGMVTSTTEAVSSMNDLAGRVGMTYGELSTLSFAASQVGVSSDQIGAAMTRAQVAFQKASEGSTTAVAAFSRIGLSVADLNGMSADEQFQRIASAIADLPTEAERAAAAVALFGRAGTQLLPLFSMGAQGIAEARAEAERLGLALTSAQAGNIDAMGDSFDRASGAIKGVIDQVVAFLAPAIKSVSDQFVELVGSIGGANIGQAIGEALLQGARFLAGVADYMIQGMKPIWDYVSAVGQQWNAVFDVGQRVANVFLGVFNVFEAVGNLVGGILANAVAGMFRAAARLADLVPGFGGWVAGLNDSADAWAATVSTFDTALMDNANQAADAFKAAFGTGDTFNQAGEAVAGPITASIDAAIAQARAAMNDVSQAPKQTAADVASAGPAIGEAVKQAVQGIDSRSSEGMKEYFRLLRGDSGDEIPQQQLRQLERIADAVEDDAIEMDVFDLAPAAGV